MKSLFVGLGSIGQRHLRNLKTLLPEAEIFAYRNSRNVPFLDENNNVIENRDISDFYKIREFNSLKEALKEKPEMVFITNPSIFHAEVAMEAIKSGAFVFVEKPLSTDINSAKKIHDLEKKFGKNLCMVGFQYRYSQTLVKLKEIIEEDLIGKIINGNIANGEYLPSWHPYEDYRKNYASRRSLGGGAILTQIHDFDYSIYLFGMPRYLFATGGKLSNLDIDVEDCVNISVCFNYKNYDLPINISLDYVSWPSRRFIKLFGDKGSIDCDLNKNIINVYLREREEILNFDYSQIQRNDIFVDELRNFIDFVRGKAEPKVNIKEGIKSLEFALAAKESMLTQKPFFFNSSN